MYFDIETVTADYTAPSFPTLPILRRLQIYGERYYYKLVRGAKEGLDSVRFYNSVTSVTHKTVGDKGQLIKWAASKGDNYQQEMEQAAAYGTLVHHFLPRLAEYRQDLIELPTAYREAALSMRSNKETNYLLENQSQLLPKLTKDLYAIHCLLTDLDFKPLAVELCLSSDVLGVAGALDLVGWISLDKPTLAILDLKTGCRDGNFYADYEAQLAIYAMLWNDNPELVAAYGKVETICNFSPKDYPVGARTFYNLKVWDWEKAYAEALSYLQIFERNHAADSGGLAIAQKKLQLITGSVGLNGGQPERVVKTYEQFVTEQHKADFESLPFADPEPEPTAEEQAASKAAADDFLQAAAKTQSDHTADAAAYAGVKAVMQSLQPAQGVPADTVDAAALFIQIPTLTSKGRPPAEYTAAKGFNALLEPYVLTGISVEILELMLKTAPQRTKVEQLVAQHLDAAVAKAKTLPTVADVAAAMLYAVDRADSEKSEQQPPAVDQGAAEPDRTVVAVIEKVEETAEGVKFVGYPITPVPAVKPAPEPEPVDPRQAALFAEPEPAKPEPENLLPAGVVNEIKAGMGLTLARERLKLANQKLHDLVRNGLQGMTAADYDRELNKLKQVRKAYLDVIDEYEQKAANDPVPF